MLSHSAFFKFKYSFNQLKKEDRIRIECVAQRKPPNKKAPGPKAQSVPGKVSGMNLVSRCVLSVAKRHHLASIVTQIIAARSMENV